MIIQAKVFLIAFIVFFILSMIDNFISKEGLILNRSVAIVVVSIWAASLGFVVSSAIWWVVIQ